VETRVSAITEHYLGHYIYMSNELFRVLYKEAPESNTIYTVLKNPDSDDKIELAKDLLSKKSVNSVRFTSSMVENFQHVVDGLNFVILILILSAGALALVVLLNLTSINISERIRELATIEVLGFYDRETSAYVYRENAVLTAFGIAVGLGLGKLLHLYVILTAETEIMMFSRRIELMSYLYSVLLTVFFSICVNVLTARRLKRINMVEALKSIE
jgi:putative ABC transport system permease protein